MAEETTQTPADQTPTITPEAEGQGAEQVAEEPSLLSGKPEGEPEGDSEGDAEEDESSSEEGKEDGEAEGVPEKYEATLPEGVELDTALVEKLTPVLKELNINQEGFQKLVDVYTPHLQTIIEANRQEALSSFKETIDGWRKETQEALGADANKKLASASVFIDNMSESKEEADQLRVLLDETGVGNHPLLVKLFIRAGKLISEDSFPSSKDKNVSGIEVDLSRLYPSMKQ